MPLRGALITAGLVGVVPLVHAAPFPPILPLASLYPAGGGDGTRGFVLVGIDFADNTGYEGASAAGDVNGDGIDDVIISAEHADPGGQSAAGASYVVFGSTQGFPAVFPLASLYPAGGGEGTRGFVLVGAHPSDLSGSSVSAAGDVNGDGIDDLIIGAPGADREGRNSAGMSYVVFGSTQGFAAVFELASLNPGRGGDGTRGFILTGIHESDSSGGSVSAAGDVNGDGVDDLIIGAASADPRGRNAAGESYVVFGSAQGFPPVFPLASLFPGHGDGSRGFVLTGINSDDFSGASVSEAGDINGDGIGDIVIGAWAANRGPHYPSDTAGASYVIFGSAQGFPAAFPLWSLLPNYGGDGTRGFVLPGIEEGDRSGGSVSAAGDVNADGIDDLIIGASGADRPERPRMEESRSGARPSATHAPETSPCWASGIGESYVVFGSRQGFPAVLPLASLRPAAAGDGIRGFVLAGIDVDRSYTMGSSVSAAGDVDGDGIGDVIIGANEATPGGRPHAGTNYVVFGSAQGFPAVFPLAQLYPDSGGDGTRGFVLPGVDAGDNAGCVVSGAGDVNGDGVDDVIIGAHLAHDHGAGYVVFGRSATR